MLQLFDQFISEKLEDKQVFLRNLIEQIHNNQDNPLSTEFLLQQSIRILTPPKTFKIEDIALQLNIHQTQLNEIPGQKQQLFQVKQVGSKMSDVLKKFKAGNSIAQDINLEILVCNKIIVNMDLPIELVFKKIYIPNKKNASGLVPQQMDIVFRLKGLDAEVTSSFLLALPPRLTILARTGQIVPSPDDGPPPSIRRRFVLTKIYVPACRRPKS